MKKMKKILTALLALTMAVTMAAIQSPIIAKADTVSTVDSSETGSLTLYKYYYENTTVPSTNPSGTGEELSDDDTTLDDANPLGGAGFTVWKIADMDGNVTVTGKTTEKYTVTGTLATDVAAAEALISNGNDTYVTATYSEATTDANGMVTFGPIDSADFGYYYVKETTTPDNVSSLPVAFVVSIPMTDKDANGGTNWIYDVVVYPKNETTSAGVTVNKVDANDDTVITTAKFVLQRNEGTDANPDWKYVAVDNNGTDSNTSDDTYMYGETNFADAAEFTTPFTITGLAQGSYRLFEVEVSDGYIMDGTIAYDFTIAKDGTISSTTTGLISNGGGTASATFTIENERPDVEKKVKDRATTDWGNETDYSIGDNIEYRIKVSVPENISKLTTFKITDTPVGIKDTINTIKIYTDEACTTEATLVAGTDYTVTAAGDGFVIDFITATGKVTDTMANTYKGTNLYIKYQAIVDTDAVSTTAGNPNTIKLDYTNGIYPEDTATDQPNSGKDEDEAYIEDRAIVYNFTLKVNKVDGSNNNAALAGAEFALYRCADGGDKTEDAIKTNGTLITAEGKVVNGSFITSSNTYQVDTDGVLEISGLEDGYYYLIETKAPAGYNLLTAPVQVPLQIDYTTTYKTSTGWAQGDDGVWKLVKHEIDSTTFSAKTADVTSIEDTNVTDGSYDLNVVNNKGFTLPATGGVGTFIFVFVGVSMMAAAVILFITTKKKEASKI